MSKQKVIVDILGFGNKYVRSLVLNFPRNFSNLSFKN